jgi:nitroreductase
MDVNRRSVEAAGRVALDLLMTRRSIRAFTKEGIDEETKRALLAAAMSAPTAHGRKSRRFAVVDRPEARKRVLVELPWFAPALGSAFNVLVLGSPSDCAQEGYWLVDCAAATENLLLAATFLGLGAVWMGIAPIEENMAAARRAFDLPEGLVPFSLVALGKPGEAPAPREEAYDDSLLVRVDGGSVP